jgi:hypothetical protein
MLIQGTTITGLGIYDSSFNSNGALLYLDSGQAASYSGSGTSWNDLSGYNNTATLTGNPAYTTAWNGNFSFNGTQYAPVTQSKFNVTYTGKTTMFSIRTVSANTGNGIYRCLFGGDNVRNFNTYMYHVSGSTWQLHFDSNGQGGISNSFTVADNQWIVVAVTQTIGGVLTYYVNGQQLGSSQTGKTFSQYLSGGTEAVAKADNYWYGDMGVCAIYGRALNASEIQQNYNALAPRYGLGIVTSNLVANYDTAGYSSGSAVADTSGNGRSLTLYNTPTATTSNRSPVLSYNGSSQYAQDNAGYGNVLNTGSGYTFDVWANPASITNGTLLAEWGNSTFNSTWTDAQMGFKNNIVAGYFSGASVAYTPVSINNWYNITFTYNGTNQGTLYINGVAQSTTGIVAKSESPTGTWVSLAHPDASGSYLGGLTGYYSGKVGPWKVYSQALTAQQVSQNFNALSSRYGF